MINKKLKKFLLLLLFLFLLTYGIYVIFVKQDSPDIVENPKESENIENEQEDTLTPEDVLKQLEGDTNLGDDVQVSIISPEGELFSQSQARMWQGELANVENETSLAVNCYWQFYINENNEEVLYREMENRSSVSIANPKVCTFTSTFIDRIGKLRVVLNIEVVNRSGEILNTFTAEREYIVK